MKWLSRDAKEMITFACFGIAIVSLFCVGIAGIIAMIFYLSAGVLFSILGGFIFIFASIGIAVNIHENMAYSDRRNIMNYIWGKENGKD